LILDFFNTNQGLEAKKNPPKRDFSDFCSITVSVIRQI